MVVWFFILPMCWYGVCGIEFAQMGKKKRKPRSGVKEIVFLWFTLWFQSLYRVPVWQTVPSWQRTQHVVPHSQVEFQISGWIRQQHQSRKAQVDVGLWEPIGLSRKLPASKWKWTSNITTLMARLQMNFFTSQIVLMQINHCIVNNLTLCILIDSSFRSDTINLG